MQNQGKPAKCVGCIPDVANVRRELVRNVRERELLSKLLRLAERKAAIDRLNAEAEASHV